jgi:hypothetical protein
MVLDNFNVYISIEDHIQSYGYALLNSGNMETA